MTEGPYTLPKGWRWVRLGEVCIINPRRPRIQREPNTPTTFIPMSAIDDESGTIGAAEERPFEQVRKGYTYFEENDILFAKITPCMENGKAAIARGLLDGIGFGSTEFHVLRPNSSVVPEWIWLFIRRERFREDAKRSFRGGVGQQRVPQEFLERYPIPLPPLEEQRRIVARIEELMGRVREARRLREEAKNDAEHLWQAILAQTFPRPGSELPEGWRWVRLGEVVITSSGNSKLIKGRLHSEPEPGFYPGFSASGQDVWLPFYEHEGEAIILSAVGARCGKCFLAKGKWTAIANTHIIWPRTELVDIHFLFYLINNERFWIRGQSAQPFVKVGESKKKLIPLPPLEEQRRIVAHLQEVQERIKALKEAQEQTEAELKRLEQAILEKAFRGEL